MPLLKPLWRCQDQAHAQQRAPKRDCCRLSGSKQERRSGQRDVKDARRDPV
jgi:hypothetical protein